MKTTPLPALLLALIFHRRLVVVVDSLPLADQIDSLPLYGPPPTPQFSGYLNGTNGCRDDSCYLHYWFVTASTNSDDDDDWTQRPVVLWLNGGPGASSLVGLVQELGPLLLTTDTNHKIHFVENPYAWTNYANLLVLESPVGVGFSYCGRMLEDTDNDDDQFPSCQDVTDDSTAAVALAALLDFFTKFPEVQSNEVFLTGESYAGVYVPLLANAIVDHNTKKATAVPIPLQGIAVGDPCTDNAAQAQSRNPLWYAHKKGLVDDTIYTTLTEDPCNTLAEMARLQQEHGIDHDEDNSQLFAAVTASFRNGNPTCRIAWRKFLLASSNGINGHWPQRYIDRYSLYGSVTSTIDDATEAYFQRPDVQAALHVRTDLPDPWKKHAVPAHFHYHKQYSACNSHAARKDRPPPPSMIDIHRSLLPHMRIWIFNGDADPCVSFEGTRTAVQRIGRRELYSYRPWFYHAAAASASFVKEQPLTFGADVPLIDAGVQLGGEVTTYEDGLVFLTVHGAGTCRC